MEISGKARGKLVVMAILETEFALHRAITIRVPFFAEVLGKLILAINLTVSTWNVEELECLRERVLYKGDSHSKSLWAGVIPTLFLFFYKYSFKALQRLWNR